MAGKKKNKPTPRKSKKTKTKLKAAPRKAPVKKKKAAKAKAEEVVQPVLNNEKLKQLYATMLKCRMLAERLHQPANATIGLEAMLVGAGAHLSAADCITMEQGGHIASLIKGTPPKQIRARMSNSHSNGSAGSSFIKPTFINPTATTASMAKGLSLARERKGQKIATLMFGTQPAGAETFEAEAMAAAAAEKLPIVFLVESSFDSRAETHVLPVASSSHEANSAHYPRITVDGADVVAVFRVAQEAIRRAREGHGPALIACMTSRANGAAQDANKNTKRHTAEDPLAFMEKYLRKRNLWSSDWSRRIAKDFTKELDAAFSSTEEKLGGDTLFDNVYSTDFGAA